MSRPGHLRVVGAASADRYLDEGVELPGGGALNMAVHWAAAGHPVELCTTIAASQRTLFEPFFERHGISVPSNTSVDGEPCSVDIRFAGDRQPLMDNFVPGVLIDVPPRLPPHVGSVPTHFVLVDVVDALLHHTASISPSPSDARWTGDFLSFRHMTPDRFSSTMEHLELGIVGWPGLPDDPMVAELADRTVSIGAVLVVTFGADGIRVVDGRASTRDDRWYEVERRRVVGSTVGCGDAFAAAFLSSWFEHGDLDRAVDAGRALGATATEWLRPLPDAAYGDALTGR